MRLNLLASALAGLLALPAGPSASAGDVAAKPCQQWLDRTLRTVEKVPMLGRRDRIIESLPTACQAFPAPLREAASRARRSGKNQLARAKTMVDASRAVLGDACAVPLGAVTGLDVSRSCPLVRSEFVLTEQALRDMAFADYLILNAMLKSVADAEGHSQAAELLLRQFSLSAALIGERARHR